MARQLPAEAANFSEVELDRSSAGRSLMQYEKLHDMEIYDANQQIRMRPVVATFFGILLVAQNTVVFYLVLWALQQDKLGELQWIFGALIAGSLAETYKISQLIVTKLFEPIDYADKHRRFK